MIEELLSRLEQGGVMTVDRMAGELGVTPALVAQMIDHLERAGRAKPLGECGAACGGCPLAGACGPGRGRVWVINGLEADERMKTDMRPISNL